MQLDGASFELEIGGSPVLVFPYDITIEGKVLSSEMGVVTIDTCPPSSNCTDAPAKLKVSAVNLPSILVPPGALVRLRYSGEEAFTGLPSPGGTERQVLIENIPEWMGALNPLSDTSRVWFGAFTAEAVVQSPPSFVPYHVGGVWCEDCWIAKQKEVAVTFPGEETVYVPLGQQRSFDITGSLAGHYVVQALNASQACESYGSLSYWLAGS